LYEILDKGKDEAVRGRSQKINGNHLHGSQEATDLGSLGDDTTHFEAKRGRRKRRQEEEEEVEEKKVT